MSRKTHCPACDSYTSSLTSAFENGEPCPSCGLGNDAWNEVLQVRQARDDDEMALRFTKMRIRNDELERQLREVNGRLERLRETIRTL